MRPHIAPDDDVARSVRRCPRPLILDTGGIHNILALYDTMYHCARMAGQGIVRAEEHAPRSVDWVESAALAGSLACLVHCLALPLIVAALPALSSVLDIPESFHLWVLAMTIPAAGFALLTGRRRHGIDAPLRLGALGLTFLVVAIVAFEGTPLETMVTVAGSLLLASAHIMNWRLRRTCCRSERDEPIG